MMSFTLIPDMLNFVYTTITNPVISKCILTYAFCISAHYICAHLYATWCTPYTIYGFILSSFLVASPHCTGLRWAIFNGANQINIMWAFVGGYLVKHVENAWKL